MKKLKLIILCCLCIIVLVACGQKKNENQLFTGTKDEIAEALIHDIENKDYKVYGKYAFADNLTDIVKSGRFETILAPYFNILGEIQSKEEPFVEETSMYYIVQYPIHFETNDMNVLITFDDEDKIYNVSFENYRVEE